MEYWHALEILPIECWQSIFNHLDDDGLEAVSLVCKYFLQISNFCKNSLQVVHPPVGMLSKLVKRFKQLKKIDLRRFQGDWNGAILEIARSEVSLKVLKYKGNKFDYDDLVVIANSFPSLEQVKVAGCSSYHVEHTQSKSIDDGVEYAASKLKFLKKIHMSRCHGVSDRSLVALSLNCDFLKSVQVDNLNAGRVTEAGIGTLLRNSPNLEALSIGSIKMDTSQSGINLENSISHAKSLNSLEFSHMDVSDMLLSAISKANLPLRSFQLKYCHYKYEGLLRVLSNYQLTQLCIVGAKLGDSDMKLILNRGIVGNLTHIDISFCHLTSSTLFLLSTNCPLLIDIRLPYASFSGFYAHEDIPLMSQNHNVQNICLRSNNVDDEWVKQLALVFPNIRVLELSFCRRLTSTGVESILKSCKFIRKLMLAGYREAKLIKDDSEFPEVMNLEELDLSYSSIDDEGLSAIAEKFPRLVSLDLTYCFQLRIEDIKNIVKNVTTLKRVSIGYYVQPILLP